ncbi:hypothetical protein BKP45_01535 [Anaerobacillus alkalidiazotrophicus]|uniref:Uncharacterized protein n=1 Tax=Anaerobacillus alkalidiazotrophicus TaxID=472963 RepID=A0A1S2M9Y7_9BACI|nr:hypothetical protein [Anaerobacillus alkalidiazotrophicus]OIJ21479.1 hypothetical protein BKP45_01535 [Anaerobacillus alkalidiazotrophicus]
MIFIYPNDVHRTTSSEVLMCERILVNFTGEFLTTQLSTGHVPLLKEICGATLIRFSVNMQAIVEELLQKLIRECETKQVA